MIGSLTGSVEILPKNIVIINVSGVGYKVSVTTKICEELSQSLESVKLYIHTHVKEDALELYGFKSVEELLFFELLIEVSGVGPKTALLIMEKGVGEIKNAIMNSDVEFFTQIPRIGKKNGQKIIIELKSKVGSLAELDLTSGVSDSRKDLFEALTAMGFNKHKIAQELKNLPNDLTSEKEKITYLIKKLGQA